MRLARKLGLVSEEGRKAWIVWEIAGTPSPFYLDIRLGLLNSHRCNVVNNLNDQSTIQLVVFFSSYTTNLVYSK